jgi:signal transduction histidine kinase/ActR/RegA family two-component response regulator
MKFSNKDDRDRYFKRQWEEQRRVIRGFAIVNLLHTGYITLQFYVSDIIFTPLTYVLLYGLYYPVSIAVVALAYLYPYRSLWLRRIWYILLSALGTMIGAGVILKTLFCAKGIDPPETCTPANRPVSGSNVAVVYILLGPFLVLVVMRNAIRYQLPFITVVVAATIYTLVDTAPELNLIAYFTMLIIIGSQLMGVLVSYNRDNVERSRYQSEQSNISLTENLRGEVLERTKAEKKAKEAEERRAQFTSVLFHEMRIPLNSVVLSMNDLETEDVRKNLPPEQVENLERINSGLNSIIGIINETLDLRKLDEGKMQIVERPFDYHLVLTDVARTMDSNWSSKGIAFSFQFDKRIDEIPTRLQGDDNLIRRVIANYLSNAAKFTPENGTIILKTVLEEISVKDVFIYTHVQDSGIGISEENQKKLFCPFVQIDPERTQGGKGTGLGLSICASIITSMGGKYGVNSRVGNGSIFWFRVRFGITDIPKSLPGAVGGTEEKVGKFAQGKIEIPRKEYKILVTDDDSNTRRIMGRLLNKLGHKVEDAADGIECIEKVQAAIEANQPFTMIIMDNQMPRLNGLETVKYLREKGFNMPIIMLTGSSRPEETTKLKNVGADLILPKPTNIDKLRESIRTLSHGGISP